MTQNQINPSFIKRVASAARYVATGSASNNWFGPSKPISPVTDQVEGRRFDYPSGYNLNYTPRSGEALSFDDLRALADNCDILRSVIETRKDQIEALEWNVRLLPDSANAGVSDEQKSRIAKIKNFLYSPDKENSFAGWIRQILEDMFVIDAVCLYKRRSVGGDLYA
ncbi:MAG: hypothetical protein WCL30_04550, partial [Pseudomonadota bacterium]